MDLSKYVATGLHQGPSDGAAIAVAQPQLKAASQSVRKPMRNPTRDRVRAELAFLRSYVADLTAQLELARQPGGLKRKAAERGREVVASERTKRQRAEAENHKLHALLAQHRSIAHKLESLVREHRLTDWAGLLPVGHCCNASSSSVGGSVGRDAEDTLARLAQEATAAYGLLDRVLQQCAMAEARVQHTSAQVRLTCGGVDATRSEREQPCVELVDSKLVPFAFAPTSAALWRAMSSGGVSDDHAIEHVVLADDSIRVQSTYPWQFNGETVRLRSRLVLKRFQTPCRLVVVWRGVTENAQGALGDCGSGSSWQNTGSDETGWVVVREMDPRPESEPEQRSCVLQTISYHVPVWRATAEPAELVKQPRNAELELGELTTLLLKTTENDIAYVTGAMESLLLAEALESVAVS